MIDLFWALSSCFPSNWNVLTCAIMCSHSCICHCIGFSWFLCKVSLRTFASKAFLCAIRACASTLESCMGPDTCLFRYRYILYIYIYSCLQFQHPNDMVLGSTCCENTHQNALNASGILDIDMEVSVELKDWKYSFWCVFASTNSGIRHKQQDAACIWQDRRDFVVVPLPDALQSSIIYATYINAVIKPGVCILCLELIWTHQVHNSHCSGPYSKRLEWSSSLCKKNSVSLIPHRWGAGAQRAGMDKQRMRFGSFRRDRSTLPKWHTSPHPPYH